MHVQCTLYFIKEEYNWIFLAFFSDQVDEEAEKIRQERLAAYEAKKSKSKLGWVSIFVFLSNLLKRGYIIVSFVHVYM